MSFSALYIYATSGDFNEDITLSWNLYRIFDCYFDITLDNVYFSHNKKDHKLSIKRALRVRLEFESSPGYITGL